jgi:hypothetical protein
VRLECGHETPLSLPTLTILGDGLGARPWCDRCGDFKIPRPVRKKRKAKETDALPF